MEAKVMLLGWVHSVEEKSTKNGSKYLLMTVKTSKKVGDNWENVWHNGISVWGKLATSLVSRVNKGDIVKLEGELDYYDYEVHGKKHPRAQIRAYSVRVINTGDKNTDDI